MKRRPFFLLEILVAMALIALCILPLLSLEWGIYEGERQEKKIFQLEQSIKHEALQRIEELYSGKYTIDQLESGGIELITTDQAIKGTLFFEEPAVSIVYITPQGKTRLFQIGAREKGLLKKQ